MNQIRTSYFCPIVMRWNVTGQLIPETLFEDRAACSSLIDTFHSCTIVVKISSMQENAPNIFPEHPILKLDHFCIHLIYVAAFYPTGLKMQNMILNNRHLLQQQNQIVN